jgi:hypothetical protein
MYLNEALIYGNLTRDPDLRVAGGFERRKRDKNFVSPLSH